MHAYTFFSYFLFSSFDYFGCNFGTNKSLNSVCVITEVVATKGFSNHQFNRLLLSIGWAADTKHAAPAHLRRAIFAISFKKAKMFGRNNQIPMNNSPVLVFSTIFRN